MKSSFKWYVFSGDVHLFWKHIGYKDYYFQQFQAVMDSLFVSFNGGMSVANFTELSACVFSWLEEHCKPQVHRISFQVTTNL